MVTKEITTDLLLNHRDFVRAVARRLLNDPHLVDDVEQQTWLAALQHPPRDPLALPRWLGQVARRLALHHTAVADVGRAVERRGQVVQVAVGVEVHKL